jgi:hypothetical protein
MDANDRHRCRARLGGLCGFRAAHHQDIDVEVEEFGHVCGDLVDHPVRIPVDNDDVLALDVAQLTQPLLERGNEEILKRTIHLDSDPEHSR